MEERRVAAAPLGIGFDKAPDTVRLSDTGPGPFATNTMIVPDRATTRAALTSSLLINLPIISVSPLY